MTHPANGGFEVHVSKSVANLMRHLQNQAIAAGLGKEFASAWQRILQLLQRDPHSTGEPLYLLPNLRLQMRLVIVAPLIIHFAVSIERPDVYVKTGELLAPSSSDS